MRIWRQWMRRVGERACPNRAHSDLYPSAARNYFATAGYDATGSAIDSTASPNGATQMAENLRIAELHPLLKYLRY
jgi:hypothetical protein